MPLVYLGIFLLAGSILLLEIALTRVFAIMLWHHLAYMVVSVAMLGFGAAGSLLTARRERRGALPARALAGLAAGYAFATLLALRLASELRVDTLALVAEPANLAALGALYAIVFLPFLCGGGAIGLALTRLAPHVNRLYGADLLRLGGRWCGERPGAGPAGRRRRRDAGGGPGLDLGGLLRPGRSRPRTPAADSALGRLRTGVPGSGRRRSGAGRSSAGLEGPIRAPARNSHGFPGSPTPLVCTVPRPRWRSAPARRRSRFWEGTSGGRTIAVWTCVS